jgi:hypothetical protein
LLHVQRGWLKGKATGLQPPLHALKTRCQLQQAIAGLTRQHSPIILNAQKHRQETAPSTFQKMDEFGSLVKCEKENKDEYFPFLFPLRGN